ncbi:pheophorbidase-like isoform X1 [Humulus lupulus]|uniref:pheophorbidase-like isoform X1 n=1 Tax=Humulus lupulus TaxID=3486 RepID=UPI002B414F02|nr:pheophorbidase-like isoform X1 [Humulus lupulus]
MTTKVEIRNHATKNEIYCIHIIHHPRDMDDNCESGSGSSNKHLHHFVLVHGAGHGGWCWYKVRRLLEASGHNVTCLDLKCSGIDPTDFNTVFSFDDYNQPLTTFMSSLSPNHKARGLDAFEFIYGLRLNQPPTGVMVKPELRRQVLYNASPVEDFILASMLLRPSPARALPSVNVVRNDSLENIVVLRVFIIKTMKDKLFKPERQENMIKQWPPSKVFAIDESDHSPFFSTPDMLFPLLLEAAISIKMP